MLARSHVACCAVGAPGAGMDHCRGTRLETYDDDELLQQLHEMFQVCLVFLLFFSYFKTVNLQELK